MFAPAEMTLPLLASPRLSTTLKRLAFIESLWGDQQTFDRLVESGRYVRLASVTCQAQEAFGAAAERTFSPTRQE